LIRQSFEKVAEWEKEKGKLQDESDQQGLEMARKEVEVRGE
jgi:hypothetical protein